MMDCTLYLMLVLMINIQVLPNYAVTVVPPSITACPGQTVLTFNCTVNVDAVRWNVFTPVRNYTNLRVPVVDGDVVTSEVSETLNPLQVVSSLTITVTAELNGSEVQCLTETSEGIIKDSGFIYFAVPPGSIELRDPNVSDVVFGRTTITSITISWTLLELEGVDYNTSITPTIPFQKASNTSIVISSVPYNTQYTITVVASNCAGSSMDTISINYSECRPPVAGNGVVIHNYTTTFEESSITFTCEDGLFPNVNIIATCTGEGHWTTDPATYMCINITGTTSGSSSDCVVTAVMSGALILIVGLVNGFAGGVLVVYCYVKWQSKHHPPPSQPAPLYEDMVTSTVKDEVELQLRDNVAYEQVR